MTEQESVELRKFYRKHNIALSKFLHKHQYRIPDWLEKELAVGWSMKAVHWLVGERSGSRLSEVWWLLISWRKIWLTAEVWKLLIGWKGTYQSIEYENVSLQNRVIIKDTGMKDKELWKKELADGRTFVDVIQLLSSDAWRRPCNPFNTDWTIPSIVLSQLKSPVVCVVVKLLKTKCLPGSSFQMCKI